MIRMENDMRPSEKNRVLVTGATGFVGANLVRRLLEDGFEVHVTTRATSDRWRILDVLESLHEHEVDLRDFDAIKKVVGQIMPEVILHLATAGVYGGKHLPEQDVIDINLKGTLNLISACEDIDYKCLVLTGSSAEYGPKDLPMSETDLCEPVNMYGITKLASAMYGQMIAQTKGRPIVTLRLFSPFGPYDDSCRLMTYAITRALGGDDLELADPDAVRDYIHVDDVTGFFLEVIRDPGRFKGEILNIGSGVETSVSHVVDRVIEITGSKSRVFWKKKGSRSFESRVWRADMEKSERLFGFRARTAFEEGLKDTVEWFRSNMSSYE
ncbi:NAD-dependent epimerase/dehydratase family protein [Nanoarchaeota archaeon]